MLEASAILKAKILIVDDQQANVLLLETLLTGAGFASIASTLDPRAVYALHEKNRFDLILLDLQMPGMDGFEVMEGLKPLEKDGVLPVLVITAQPDHKLRALRAGARDSGRGAHNNSRIGCVPKSTSAKGRPAGPGRCVSRPRQWKMVTTISFGA